MSEQRKAVIKNADMSEEMQQDAVDIASQALAKYNIEKASRISAHGRIPTLPSFGRWGGGLSIGSRRGHTMIISRWHQNLRSVKMNCRLSIVTDWICTRPLLMQFFAWTPNLTPACHYFYLLQDVAAYIKKEFDKKHNPTWWGELLCLIWLYRQSIFFNAPLILPANICVVCDIL